MSLLNRATNWIIFLSLLVMMFYARTGYCETCQEFQQYIQQQFDTIYSPKYSNAYCEATLETTTDKLNVWQDCDCRSLYLKTIYIYCGDRVIGGWLGGNGATQYSLREKHVYCDEHITDGEISYSDSCACPAGAWSGNLCGGGGDVRDLSGNCSQSNVSSHKLIISCNIG